MDKIIIRNTEIDLNLELLGTNHVMYHEILRLINLLIIHNYDEMVLRSWLVMTQIGSTPQGIEL